MPMLFEIDLLLEIDCPSRLVFSFFISLFGKKFRSKTFSLGDACHHDGMPGTGETFFFEECMWTFVINDSNPLVIDWIWVDEKLLGIGPPNFFSRFCE
jgi:hypothetical protein